MLMQDRALQPLDEPVRPRVPRLRLGVAEAERPTGVIKRPLEFEATVGEHPAQPPAGVAIQRHQDATQEVDGRFGVASRQQPRHVAGARGIAGRFCQT